MDKLLIDAEFMRIGYALAIPLIFIYFLTVIIKNQMVKWFFSFFKMLAYFGLAYAMWIYYKDAKTVDIVSAFTFIFCCLESADNFISCISMPIEHIREYKERKFQEETNNMFK